MFHKLRSASHLSFADWLLFIRAWVWLLIFDLGLRLRPFPDLQSFAARLASRPIPTPEQTQNIIQTLRVAVDRARYNHLYSMTCLRRALTLQKLLSNKGIAAELRIGVHKKDGKLSAHAWLEYLGQPIGEPERITEHYTGLQR